MRRRWLCTSYGITTGHRCCLTFRPAVMLGLIKWVQMPHEPAPVKFPIILSLLGCRSHWGTSGMPQKAILFLKKFFLLQLLVGILWRGPHLWKFTYPEIQLKQKGTSLDFSWWTSFGSNELVPGICQTWLVHKRFHCLVWTRCTCDVLWATAHISFLFLTNGGFKLALSLGWHSEGHDWDVLSSSRAFLDPDLERHLSKDPGFLSWEMICGFKRWWLQLGCFTWAFLM